MPAWFEAARQVVELAVVALLAAQAVGRWAQRRESNEQRAGESMATLRRDLGRLERAQEALRGDVQDILLQLANMRPRR